MNEFPCVHLGSDKGLLDGVRPGKPKEGQANVSVHVHTLKIHAGEFPFVHLGSDKGLLDGVRPGKPKEGKENVPVLVPSSALKNHADNLQSE